MLKVCVSDERKCLVRVNRLCESLLCAVCGEQPCAWVCEATLSNLILGHQANSRFNGNISH